MDLTGAASHRLTTDTVAEMSAISCSLSRIDPGNLNRRRHRSHPITDNARALTA
jgi:hypothetical protein